MNAPGSGASVAVIGGGWAGCAAAVELAQSGMRVTLFEQARILGGRARRVAIDGIALDNGQHVCIGGYRQTLASMATVHGAARAHTLFHRIPLTLRPFGARRVDAASFTAWRAPAPLHLVGGVLTARGLSWRERRLLVGGFRSLKRAQFQCPPTQSVAECFASTPDQAMRAFWVPLCVAALNTLPQRASAQLFANVLHATFTGRARNSDLLLPATDLSSLFPDAAMHYIEARGGSARLGTNVRGIALQAGDVVVTTNVGRERFAAAIVAVGPHQLAAAVGNQDDEVVSAWRATLKEVAAFAYESITTVYLAYAAPVPTPSPIARLDDAPGQWVFDRSATLRALPPANAQSVLAVVISGNGPHDQLDQRALATMIDAQLRRLAPMPKLLWSRVIAERRATYACTPSLQRPSAGRIAPGLYVAGDYTDNELPATIEAATRSGARAAAALIADMNADGALIHPSTSRLKSADPSTSAGTPSRA